MPGNHHPRAEALKASHARLATGTPARDAGGCPGLTGRRARAPRSWLQPASAPTTHELFPGSAIAARTAGSQRHLYCPRGPGQEASHGERPRKREGCAGAPRCEGGARGRFPRSLGHSPLPELPLSGRAACPAHHVGPSPSWFRAPPGGPVEHCGKASSQRAAGPPASSPPRADLWRRG